MKVFYAETLEDALRKSLNLCKKKVKGLGETFDIGMIIKKDGKEVLRFTHKYSPTPWISTSAIISPKDYIFHCHPNTPCPSRWDLDVFPVGATVYMTSKRVLDYYGDIIFKFLIKKGILGKKKYEIVGVYVIKEGKMEYYTGGKAKKIYKEAMRAIQ